MTSMTKTDLKACAAGLPSAWRSIVLGRPGGANVKVMRMDGAAYPEEVHPFDEALLVLDGRMALRIHDETISVESGELFIVPAGLPHAVAPGSCGTLIIIDAVQQ